MANVIDISPQVYKGEKMIYEEIKKMLRNRNSHEGSGEFHASVQSILKNAENFLSNISLRKYLGKLTPDTLLVCTAANKNWLYVDDVDMDMVAEGCRKVNEIMRNIYGKLYDSAKGILDPEIKELVSWCALFPGKEKELLKAAFNAMYDEDEDNMCIYCPPEKSVVFMPNFGSAIGDELLLPSMIQALRASILICLIKEEENELMPFLLESHA